MSREILLTQSKIAIVDDENYKRLSKYKWHTFKNRNTYYAVRTAGEKPKEYQILMHREILGLRRGDGKQTDHRNHCGLDNREVNLRVCTHSQNAQNGKSRNGTSRYKGVGWHEGKWQVQICHYGKRIYLGRFQSEADAAKAYNQTARELFGEFALLNKVAV